MSNLKMAEKELIGAILQGNVLAFWASAREFLLLLYIREKV